MQTTEHSTLEEIEPCNIMDAATEQIHTGTEMPLKFEKSVLTFMLLRKINQTSLCVNITVVQSMNAEFYTIIRST